MLKNGNTKKLFNEIIAGLSENPKRLLPKFFYDEKGSALFDKICDLEEYYPTRTELKIMEENIDEIASLFDENTLFIEFGSGSSLKTRLILSRLNRLGGYIPIDISEDHLEKTAEKLKKEFPDLNIFPLAADYTESIVLPQINKAIDNKIAYFPGSTIGNFTRENAKRFLKKVALVCGENGGLIIGVDLKKDIKILEAAYNDKEGITAEFNLNMLNNINKNFDFNFETENFKHQAVFNEDENRIEMHLISLEDQEISSNGEMFHIKKNESIVTEYSNKYTLDDFAELASEFFDVRKVWTDNKNYFSVQYLTVK